MDKLWKLAVIGLLGFLIGSATLASASSHHAVYLTNEAVTRDARVTPSGKLKRAHNGEGRR